MFKTVDVCTSKNPRGTYTKRDKEDMMLKTTFFSKLKRVCDTNSGTIKMIQLRDKQWIRLPSFSKIIKMPTSLS